MVKMAGLKMKKTSRWELFTQQFLCLISSPPTENGSSLFAARDGNLFFSFFQVLKWNFTAPRAEFVEQLKEQMRPCFGKTLHTNLFHADFKYHLIGISTMQQVLQRYSRGNSSHGKSFVPSFSTSLARKLSWSNHSVLLSLLFLTWLPYAWQTI